MASKSHGGRLADVEVNCYLKGHLKATVVSEASNITMGGIYSAGRTGLPILYQGRVDLYFRVSRCVGFALVG